MSNYTDTPGSDPIRPAAITPDTETDGNSTETPPLISDAIASIERYEFTPYKIDEPIVGRDQDQAEDKAVLAYMMFNARATTVLPQLHTEAWPYGNRKPNPISMSKARRLLAAAYATVPCEIAGTGEHGYAWMIETEKEWQSRKDVDATIIPPTKPIKEASYDIQKQFEYSVRMEEYKLFNHLNHEGRVKLTEWFGKSMFLDLHVNDMLPVTTTPNEMIEHLTTTYCQGRDNRRYMEQVEKAFNTAFDHKQPVEAYFMRLQEARTQAELLGQPFTTEQTMNKAMGQFEKFLGKDAYKAEKRWNEKTVQTWGTFKEFWKDELHQWDTVNKATRQANHASAEQFAALTNRFNAMQVDMSALQAENESMHDQHSALIAHARHAAGKQTQGSSDEGSLVSAITDHMSAIGQQIVSGLNAQQATNREFTLGTGTATDTTHLTNKSHQDLLRQAKQREPGAYKHLNGGRGRLFGRYCFHCGVNTTHSTRGCYELPESLKQQYKLASTTNLMGGSTKFLDRHGKYQVDYGFDSL